MKEESGERGGDDVLQGNYWSFIEDDEKEVSGDVNWQAANGNFVTLE